MSFSFQPSGLSPPSYLPIMTYGDYLRVRGENRLYSIYRKQFDAIKHY